MASQRASVRKSGVTKRDDSSSASKTPVTGASMQFAAAHPSHATTSQLMQMQKALGNQAVQRMLKADAAAQLMGEEEEELQMKQDGGTIQRVGPEDEEELQLKADGSAIQRAGIEEEELQMKAASSAAKPAQMKSGANKLPEQVQAKMESSMGADFSNVNIYEGSEASEVGALAYTQGNDIHFAPGQFKPDDQSGQELIGHELAHVVQQRQGRVQPTTQAKGMPINDDPGLEQEADQIGKKAASSPDVEL